MAFSGHKFDDIFRASDNARAATGAFFYIHVGEFFRIHVYRVEWASDDAGTQADTTVRTGFWTVENKDCRTAIHRSFVGDFIVSPFFAAPTFDCGNSGDHLAGILAENFSDFAGNKRSTGDAGVNGGSAVHNGFRETHATGVTARPAVSAGKYRADSFDERVNLNREFFRRITEECAKNQRKRTEFRYRAYQINVHSLSCFLST
jgi:hypothetical protein